MFSFRKKPYVSGDAAKKLAGMLSIPGIVKVSKGKAKEMLLTGNYGVADVLELRAKVPKKGKKMCTMNDDGNLTWIGEALWQSKKSFHNMPAIIVIKDGAGSVQAIMEKAQLKVLPPNNTHKGKSVGTLSYQYSLN